MCADQDSDSPEPVGAEIGPIGSGHVVDANDAVVIGIRDVNPAGRIQRDAGWSVELATAGALCAVSDGVGAVQVVRSQNPSVSIGEVERRVGRVVSGGAANDSSRAVVLHGCAVDRLHGSVGGERTAEGAGEGVTARDVAALASAGAKLGGVVGGKDSVDEGTAVG